MRLLPNIPEVEYQQRLDRLRGQMRDKGLDALLLGTGPNLAYFSGYPSPAMSVPQRVALRISSIV